MVAHSGSSRAGEATTCRCVYLNPIAPSVPEGFEYVLHQQEQMQIICGRRFELGYEVTVVVADIRILCVHKEAATADLGAKLGCTCDNILQHPSTETSAFMFY